MIIVIDGYNVLREIFPHAHGDLSRHRLQVTQELAHYHARVGAQIILVFDGGESKHATRSVHRGVVVIYAGRSRSADDWIIDYLNREKHRELLLVTRDREIKECARTLNIQTMDGSEFYHLVQDSLIDTATKEFARRGTEAAASPRKLKSNRIAPVDEFPKDSDQSALDLLMEQASLSGMIDKDEPLHQSQRRQRASHTPSKEERARGRILKKLKPS